MPRSRLVWLQIADRQYRDLPDDVRDAVDHRLGQLLENPTVDPDSVYNPAADHWSVTTGDAGFLFYAVVRVPATVIVLRVISLG